MKNFIRYSLYTYESMCILFIYGKGYKLNYHNLIELRDKYKCYNFELLDDKIGNSRTKHKCRDGMGYLYFLSMDNIKDARNKAHSIVAKYNPYSIQNIQQFIWNNNSKTQVLSKSYIANKEKIHFKCECGKEYRICWNRVNNLNKVTCNCCSHSKPRLSFEQIKEEVEKCGLFLVGENVQKSKDLTVADKDGIIWHTTLDRLRKGQLPQNKISSLEYQTQKYLDELYIKYEYQKTFEYCKYKHLLRFDFYLPEFHMCIEVNGKQHYESIEYFGGDKTFKLQQKRDKIKQEYCIQNNIILITIPHYEFNKNQNYKTYINKIIN